CGTICITKQSTRFATFGILDFFWFTILSGKFELNLHSSKRVIAALCARSSMKNWYQMFQSQTWFRNTYLVNNHYDVREKNNIYNSGCHFTCLSMMLNVNAAFLASELSKKYYFEKDEQGLVWDRNKPSEVGDCISIPFIVTPQGVMKDIKVTLIEKVSISSVNKAEIYINDKHNENLHLICGNASHSLLVAGIKDKSFFVWDPDTSWLYDEIVLINQNINGENTIAWLYEQYGKDESIEFWAFEIKPCT
ncbi:hypothetical protein ERW51_18715, partial [Aliivibrio finisterrensis]|uniref:hypothetical protein n=1 Tax=Aliivibrio finisterrensis TaxID=511998 RepID=UPI00101EC220